MKNPSKWPDFFAWPSSYVYGKFHGQSFLWQAVYSKIQSNQKSNQYNHNGIEFKLKNMLKESKQAFNWTLAYQFNLIMTK